jgi:nucleoside permease NupC
MVAAMLRGVLGLAAILLLAWALSEDRWRVPLRVVAAGVLPQLGAMCGFANFGSLGILIGGMGAMVPERKPEIVALGLRSILSGTLATCMSGAIVGML